MNIDESIKRADKVFYRRTKGVEAAKVDEDKFGIYKQKDRVWKQVHRQSRLFTVIADAVITIRGHIGLITATLMEGILDCSQPLSMEGVHSYFPEEYALNCVQSLAMKRILKFSQVMENGGYIWLFIVIASRWNTDLFTDTINGGNIGLFIVIANED